MYVMGVDIGSTTSKAVILDASGEPCARELLVEGIGTHGGASVTQAALNAASLKQDDISVTVATGYGRKIYPGATRQVSELSCHVKGVHAALPQARTLIDVGGQDAKVMTISPQGLMVNFQMNDKCAAGTGRFLDVMASILKIDVTELQDRYFASQSPVKISSTCTVFAESEVISQLASGQAPDDVVAGICRSVSVRFASLMRRVGVEPIVAMSGGVAKNAGVVDALSRELQEEIVCPPHAQYMGAYGAALYALEMSRGKITL